MCLLELEIDSKADAVLFQLVSTVDVGHVVVVQTAHILHGEHLEDVADADGEFHVRLVAHHEGSLVPVAGREHEEVVVVGADERIVLVCQMTEEHLETNILTQFHLLQQGNAVENLSVETPVDEQRNVAVIEELHVAEHIERPTVELHEVGEVRLGREEHGEGHLVPLYTTFQICLDATACTRQPELLEDGGFGDVVVVLSSHETIHADGMFEREDRSILVNVQTLLLAVDEGFAWRITEAELHIRRLDVGDEGFDPIVIIAIAQIDEFSCRGEFRVVKSGCPGDVVVGFVVELQFHIVHIHHLIHLAGLEGTIDIVLGGV